MSFLRRDSRAFTHFPARFEADDRGDGKNVYDEPGEVFDGHLQPAGESHNYEAYGMDMRYAYAVYTDKMPEMLREKDRLTSRGRTFEVKAVKRFSSYARLLVEEAPFVSPAEEPPFFAGGDAW